MAKTAKEEQTERMAQQKPWVRLAGGLKHLHKETSRINEIMKREFEQIA
jgi:hypothetical protein